MSKRFDIISFFYVSIITEMYGWCLFKLKGLSSHGSLSFFSPLYCPSIPWTVDICYSVTSSYVVKCAQYSSLSLQHFNWKKYIKNTHFCNLNCSIDGAIKCILWTWPQLSLHSQSLITWHIYICHSFWPCLIQHKKGSCTQVLEGKQYHWALHYL